MIRSVFKKIICTTCVAACVLAGKAQVSVQFTNTGYLVTKDQLWNMLLVNTGTAIASCRIEITLADMSSGQLLCRFTGKNMPLPAGPKAITIQDALPVQTTNYSPNFTDANPYGFLPPGRYNMCIDVLRNTENNYTSVGDYCEDIEAVAFSPVLLVLPENLAEADTRTPLFTWLAPMPVTQFSQLNYTLVLAEVLQHQNPIDAVTHNLPLLNVNNLSAAQYNYMPTQPPLLPGKIYAWQVTAKNGVSNVSVSEVFTFSIQDTAAVKPAIRQAVYTPLKKDAGADFITITGWLNVEYLNEVNDKATTLKLVDLQATSPGGIVKDTIPKNLVYGPNYISLNVKDEYGLTTGRFYKLILTNSKHEEWTVTFRLK